MKVLRTALLTIITASVFTACEQIPGPQGPVGLQGNPGVTGTSAFYNVPYYSWVPDSTIMLKSRNDTALIVTQNAINNGVIQVYIETDSNTFMPLPYTYPINDTVTQTLTYSYTLDNITLEMQNSKGLPKLPVFGQNYTYKAVVIPTALLKQHPGFNIKDYNMVKQLLDLKN